MIILDVGCGRNKVKGAIGIDVNPQSDADIIHDLNKFPWPFRDNEFDLIICHDVLEHLDDVIKVMEEIWRISRDEALVKIQVPSASGFTLFSDPTHKQGFTSRTFDYFIEGCGAYRFRYSHAKFRLVDVRYKKRGANFLDEVLIFLSNKFKDTYEARFMWIYPIPTLCFQLKVDKGTKQK